MPRFFGSSAAATPQPDDKVDPFGIGKRRASKPVMALVRERSSTVGIEMMLPADIVVAADATRFHQLESR